MPGGAKRGHKQEAAIAAILAEKTLADAARVAHVSERTLKNWLRDPDFRAAFEEAKREALQRAISRLTAHAGDAVETLHQNLTAERPGDQIRAASELLSQLVRLREHGDLDERVRSLEERLAEQGAKR